MSDTNPGLKWDEYIETLGTIKRAICVLFLEFGSGVS